MHAEQVLQATLGRDVFSADDMLEILRGVGIDVQPEQCRVLLYKAVEKALVDHYREAYGIDLSPRMYSINEINGLVLFLHIRTHGRPEMTVEMEAFFEMLFFSEEGETGIKELREENKQLVEMVRELRSRISEMNSVWIDRGFEESRFREVDGDVLLKMETELVALREQVAFEHSSILEAWHRLAEEHIKNKQTSPHGEGGAEGAVEKCDEQAC